VTRRVILSVVVLAIAGGGVSAFAEPTSPGKPTHELCVATSKDPDHNTTQDFCITWPGPVRHS
jgi:hypothetical protein